MYRLRRVAKPGLVTAVEKEVVEFVTINIVVVRDRGVVTSSLPFCITKLFLVDVGYS